MPAEFEIALRVDSFCRGSGRASLAVFSRGWRPPSWSAPWYRTATEIDQLAEPTVDDDTTELGAMGEDWWRERMATLTAWRRAHERLGEHIADESTIAGFVAERWLEWSVVTFESCVVATESRRVKPFVRKRGRSPTQADR